MIPMSLVGVRVEVPSNQPIVLLRENEGQRYLPIFIGQPEATAIVYALQGTETPRPMTHDLFKTVLDDLGAKVVQVVITELHDGTFFAEIEISRATAAPAGSRPAPPTPSPWPSATATRCRSSPTRTCSRRPGCSSSRTRTRSTIEQFREFLDQVRPEDFAHGTE